jgi:hypothetical protein
MATWLMTTNHCSCGLKKNTIIIVCSANMLYACSLTCSSIRTHTLLSLSLTFSFSLQILLDRCFDGAKSRQNRGDLLAVVKIRGSEICNRPWMDTRRRRNQRTGFVSLSFCPYFLTTKQLNGFRQNFLPVNYAKIC